MDFEAVRAIALTLPEVEESTSFGAPAFKVHKKLLARLRVEDVLVVMIDLADKEFLIHSRPTVYFTTPHYDGYPAVLVKLSAALDDELRQLLAAAWRYVAPPRLVATSASGHTSVPQLIRGRVTVTKSKRTVRRRSEDG